MYPRPSAAISLTLVPVADLDVVQPFCVALEIGHDLVTVRVAVRVAREGQAGQRLNHAGENRCRLS